jgi:hypothetical protein
MFSDESQTAQSAAGGSRAPASPQFPDVAWVNGRGYVLRSALNRYKAELMAAAQGVAPVVPPHADPDPLVPLKAAGMELGVGRRTIGRRIAKSKKAEAA